jgi:PKD repeat protein
VLNVSNASQPVPGVLVQLYETGDGASGGNPVAENVTDVEGRYFLRARPGTYRLAATPPATSPYTNASLEVTVPDNATASQDVLLSGAGYLRATILSSTSGSPVEAKMAAFNATFTERPLVRFANASTGEVVLKVRPGLYEVGLTPNPQLLLGMRSFTQVNVTPFVVTSVNGTLDPIPLLVPKPYPRQEGTEGVSLNFTGVRSIAQPDPVSSYAWQFGDGATATGANVSHAYTFGEYLVRLTVQNTTGGNVSELLPVYVNQPGSWNTRRLVTDATGALPAYQDLKELLASLNETSLRLHVRMVNLTSPQPTKFEVAFTLPDSSSFTGCVEINQTYVVSFPSECLPTRLSGVEVNLTDHSLRFTILRGAIGLQNGSVLSNFAARTYAANLAGKPLVDEALGPSGTDSGYFIALPSEDPVAAFTLSHTIATTLDFVEFFDASADYDGDIAGWAWDFDDQQASQLARPAHRYTVPCALGPPPQCVPLLEVTDIEGKTNRETEVVFVNYVPED